MSERTFEGDDWGYDFREHVDELRCRPTEWLRSRRIELVREQRRLHVEELAVTRVLDERGQIDVTNGHGVSARSARKTVEMARSMESTPKIAAAAHAGDLSREQLEPLLEIADASTDAGWAQRAPNYDPIDLNRVARTQRQVTNDDAAARRDAREWRMWWRERAGMLSVRGEIPDVDGALVKSVFEHMVERMRPAKGESWDTYARRGADALVELCRNYADVEPPPRTKPHVVVNVGTEGNADVDGVPLARATLAALLEDAVVEQIFVDDGDPFAYGPGRRTLPTRLDRAIRQRDQHCRWPGCERTHGLQIHHLVPVSEGGRTEPGNLAAACVGGGTDHHHELQPHGPYRLTGNPNQPDGLRLVHRDELDQPAEARAGPAP